MRSIFTTICLVLFFFNLHGSNPAIDSLEKQLAIAQRDTAKMNICNTLSEALMRQGDFDNSLKYAKRALDLANSFKSTNSFEAIYKINLAKAYNNIGSIHREKVEYDKALEWYSKAAHMGELLISEYPSDRLYIKTLAIIFNNIGGTNYFKGDFNKSMEAYFRALSLFERIGDKQKIGSSYNNIGLVHEAKKDYEKAKDFYMKALSIHMDAGNKKGMASSYDNLGNVLRAQKEYDAALDVCFKAVLINKETGNKNWLAFNYENIGSLLIEKNEIDKALSYYMQSLEIRKEIGEIRGMVNSHNSIGELYLKKRDYIHAKENALIAQKTAKEIAAKPELIKAYLTLSICDSALGNFKTALSYHQLYVQTKDSVFNESSSKQIAEMQTKYETEKKEQQINLLQQQEANQKLKISQQKLQIWTLIALSLLVVVSSILFYYHYKQKQKQIMAKKLLEEQTLRYSSVVEAQENEKVRIARDLHDGICQMLAATKMKFSNLNEDVNLHMPQKSINYKECITLLDEATSELRTVAHDIMPPALKSYGLTQALKHLASHTFYPHTKHSFEVFGTLGRLTPSHEINIYRVAQELFANVLKHSGATEVSIQLLKTGTQLSLIVEDNGKGITSKKASGMGLSNINLRAQMLNGKFNLEASPTGGTLASLTLILHNKSIPENA